MYLPLCCLFVGSAVTQIKVKYRKHFSSVFLTWNVLLPHLGPQRGVVALSFLVGTRSLMHAEEGERQSDYRVALQHVGAVVADGVHRQRTGGLVDRL